MPKKVRQAPTSWFRRSQMRSMRNWLAGVLGGRARSRRGPGTWSRPRPRLVLEPLEDRAVPTAVTILGSHLLTSGGLPQNYLVAGVTPVTRGDVTVDLSPGTYNVVSGTSQPYGTFTVPDAGAVAATGALSAAGSAID